MRADRHSLPRPIHERRQKQRRQHAKRAKVDFSLRVGIIGRTRECVCRGGAAGTHEGAAVCLA